MTTEFDIDATLAKYVNKPEALAKPELILLYSQPGGGKTHLSGTAIDLPTVTKGLYLDTEGSTVGVITDQRWDIIRVDRHENPFGFLHSILEGLEKGTSYDVIVIDTFDVAQGWAEAHFDEKAPVGRSGEKDGFWKWAKVKDWSIWVARSLKKSSALGILVVHDEEVKSDSGSLTKRLSLLGKAKDVLPGIPDVVAYLERKTVEGEEHTFTYFATSDNKVTKNRFQFPPKVQDATLPKLYQFIDDKKENN